MTFGENGLLISKIESNANRIPIAKMLYAANGKTLESVTRFNTDGKTSEATMTFEENGETPKTTIKYFENRQILSSITPYKASISSSDEITLSTADFSITNKMLEPQYKYGSMCLICQHNDDKNGYAAYKYPNKGKVNIFRDNGRQLTVDFPSHGIIGHSHSIIEFPYLNSRGQQITPETFYRNTDGSPSFMTIRIGNHTTFMINIKNDGTYSISSTTNATSIKIDCLKDGTPISEIFYRKNGSLILKTVYNKDNASILRTVYSKDGSSMDLISSYLSSDVFSPLIRFDF